MTDAEVIEWYGRVIWDAFEKDRDADRRRWLWEIDTIIEAAGLPPFDWQHSSESIREFAVRTMPTEAARTAMLQRCDKLDELDERSVELYNQVDSHRRRASRNGS